MIKTQHVYFKLKIPIRIWKAITGIACILRCLVVMEESLQVLDIHILDAKLTYTPVTLMCETLINLGDRHKNSRRKRL